MRRPDPDGAYSNPQPGRGSLLSKNLYKRQTTEYRFENGKNKPDIVVSYQILDVRRLALELLLTAAITGGAIATSSAIQAGRATLDKKPVTATRLAA